MGKDKEFRISDLKKFARIGHVEDMPDVHIQLLIWGFLSVTEWVYPKMKRPYWMIYWNAEPGHILELKKKTVPLMPDKIYVLPPYTEFTGTKTNDFIQFYVHFRVEGGAFENVWNEMLEFPAGNFPEQILEIVSTKKKLFCSFKLQKLIYEILALIPASHFRTDTKAVLDSRIRLVLHAINNDPGAPNRIKDLSALVKMSQNNFHRRFLAETNVSPKQYILRRRLEYARQLLMDTQKTLDEIAEEAGFFSRYHLSKAFKAYYLYPPVTFKKRMSITQSTRYADPPVRVGESASKRKSRSKK